MLPLLERMEGPIQSSWGSPPEIKGSPGAPEVGKEGPLHSTVQSFVSSLWPRWVGPRTISLQPCRVAAAAKQQQQQQQQEGGMQAVSARRLLLDTSACGSVCCCCGRITSSRPQQQQQGAVVEDVLLLPVGSGERPPLGEVATLLQQQQQQQQQREASVQLPLGMERAKICLAIVQQQQQQQQQEQQQQDEQQHDGGDRWEDRHSVLLLECSLPDWKNLKASIPWRSHVP